MATATVRKSSHDKAWLDRLHDYADQFRADFRRRDQVRWAAVYLQGLLGPVARKTIGAMAPALELPPELEVDDLAQALQHFVNQSPWDEHKVWERYRSMLAPRLADDAGAVALDDIAFVKQGQHSVGVQRQYSAALGRKTNCQVAVAVHHVALDEAIPLALQLYLPRAWQGSVARLDTVGVPPAQRRPQSKSSLALALLDELHAQSWPIREVHAGPGFADPDFRRALAQRSWRFFLVANTDSVCLPGEHLADIRGERGLLCRGKPGDAHVPPDSAATVTQRLRKTLLDRLGLDHFEGRSWRGFHHHACLVMLAFGFHWMEANESK